MSIPTIPHSGPGEDQFYPTQQFFVPTAYSGYAGPEITRSNLSLHSLLAVIYRFRYLILVTTLIAISVSALFSEKIEPTYTSTALVVVGQYIPPIQGETGRLLNQESLKDTALTTHLTLMKSFNIAELVLVNNKDILAYLEHEEIPQSMLTENNTAARAEEVKLKTLLDSSDIGPEDTPDAKNTEAKKNSQQAESAQPLPTDLNAARLGSDTVSYEVLSEYLELVAFEHLKNTNTVQISAQAKHPIMAAKIANAHAQAFIALVRARLLDNARVNLAFLKSRKEQASRTATDARTALVEFAEANSIFLQIHKSNNPHERSQTNQLGNRLFFLSGALSDASKNRSLVESEYRFLRDAPAGAGLRGDNAVRVLQVELAKKQGEYDSLKKFIRNTNNPYMVQLRTELKSLKEQVNSDKESEVAQSEIKYRALENQERLLREEIEKVRKQTIDESKSMVRFSLLEQEDRAAQDLFEQLSRQLEEVYVNLNSNQKHVSLIDPARAPTVEKEKHNYLNLLIGCFLGPIIGIALAFFLDLLDNTIRTVDDLKQSMDVPLLGIIPRFSPDLENVIGTVTEAAASEAEPVQEKAEQEQSSFDADESLPEAASFEMTELDELPPAPAGYPMGGPSDFAAGWTTPTLNPVVSAATFVAPRSAVGDEPGLITPTSKTYSMPRSEVNGTARSTTIVTSRSLVLVSAPNSSESEAFRNIRTSVNYGSNTQCPKLILVTSAQKHDGKSTVCCNLAVSMAQISKRTLLIDADLRIPTIHKSFHLSRLTPGLGNYLVGEKDYSEVIFESPVPNLFLLLAGSPVEMPGELIGSKRMVELLDLLADEFDQIIIDSPPVARVADALLLARIVEGVVFVVRSGKTPQPAAESAFMRLRQMDARILGAVLNDVESIPGYKEADYYYVTEEYDALGEMRETV